ncbi:hypothetical protein NW762_006177 [Fusarium torreyae]|uniref:Monocarboxylate transporter 4 n=1 Tax=Fusarium torreyae TaxID=1237075 RepID=A0A9W8VE45_9HYPO|nr:hypothetical protein NW762_006177 [Fusarium torreyae]
MDTPANQEHASVKGSSGPLRDRFENIDLTSLFHPDLSDGKIGRTPLTEPSQNGGVARMLSEGDLLANEPFSTDRFFHDDDFHNLGHDSSLGAFSAYKTQIGGRGGIETSTLVQNQQGQNIAVPFIDREQPAAGELRMPKITPSPPAKIGNRFSFESSETLKAWLSDHIVNPYPSSSDIESLQRQTGLERAQVTNWLANARRKLKKQPVRPPTPLIRPAESMTIPPVRRELYTASEDMSPLQRWQNSPPEHEPASVSAIAEAVSGYIPAADDPLCPAYKDSSFGESSSAGSTVASQTSSAISSASGHSLGSIGRIRKAIRRKRRRVTPRRPNDSRAYHLYQCTFCAETFKTKWSWTRHETSLHLSLEQWVCTPTGSKASNSNSDSVCVYCGLLNPDDVHLQSHDPQACHGKSIEGRTFYRKDHLQQHLKLVHHAQFMKWPMESWKNESSQVRSRCGFCGMVMNHWSDRTDHIAEHFKAGQTMADWKGDWGFEDHMLDMVENSMPPYLIHFEQNSPWPFRSQLEEPGSSCSNYELIKLELEYFHSNYTNARQREPSDHELLFESCCIIFGSESLSRNSTSSCPSWLRDLLMSSEVISKQARLQPLKNTAKSRITKLRINGKDNIFEECLLEEKLRQYVDIPKLLGQVVTDHELQHEAATIVQGMEMASKDRSTMFVGFLTRLIFASSNWLVHFRERADLPFMNVSTPWAANNFPQHHVAHDPVSQTLGLQAEDVAALVASSSMDNSIATEGIEGPASFHFLNDSNFYRRLGRELTRFVMSSMSWRNPNQHVPTDEELQHQARWIMFDDGDPWNQTPADNSIWLEQFKRHVGLLPAGDPISD